MKITHIGGPTAFFSLGGLTFLTDPAFDEPRDYQLPGRVMTKLIGPALPAADLGPVDVVLLSHDQHKDNLDESGRALLPSIPTVLSTPGAAERIPGVRGLATWESVGLADGTVTVTAVPALHGPEGAEDVLGVVTGFVLQGEGLPTVYVSGDNASLGLVKEIADRFGPVDVAILFAGAARTPLMNGANLTLTSTDAAQAAQLLQASTVVPVHTEGWKHFTEGPDQFVAAFREAGLADRVTLLEHGVATPVG
ncbi:MBL fold metallo-hydrolase [Kribbella sp. NPDC026611]|uniref:MBL fold metallo-hydrolase n=1 Tax=Kribbella sp. NPDC026611 TaxID=3154911 RepID=UPI0033E953F7